MTLILKFPEYIFKYDSPSIVKEQYFTGLSWEVEKNGNNNGEGAIKGRLKNLLIAEYMNHIQIGIGILI